MRIVQVEKQRKWAGQTQRTFHVAAGLQRRGHKVLLVCVPGSAVGERARAAGVSVLLLPMRGWQLFPSALRLAQHLRQERFDILHAHGARDHLLGAIARTLSRRMPLIRTKHNLTLLKGPVLYRRFTTRLIAVSHAAEAVLRRGGVRQEKIDVVYDGVDVARLRPGPKERRILKELGIAPDDFVIGTAGRLGSKSKGIPTLLRAARRVAEQAPRARFLLVGRKTARVEELAESSGLGNRVILTDFRQDMPAVLSTMDLYVQPSVREALSSSVLEAMALGKPVVATRVGGIPEAVAEGETGLLCESEDAQGLARAILSLIAQPEKLQEMGKKARARVEKKFDLNRMIDAVEATYRKSLRDMRG